MLAILPFLLHVAAFAPVESPDSARAGADGTRPRFVLALSGGLARGLAEIGVLRALEEEGVRPDMIVGTSMGSLLGAMWAGGQSSRSIQRQFHSADVQLMFEPRPRESGWRGNVTPRPWLVLFGSEGMLRAPPGMLDDSFLSDLLARSLLNCDGLAQGDFDRLLIPWRAVGTDLETFTSVVLDSGSVARAARTSVSVPVIFPGVVHDGRLLVDGGMSAHLPIAIAHKLGARHVLGVDVAPAAGTLDERSSTVRVTSHLVQQMNRKGRLDARPGTDHVILLEMPGISPADFRLVDTMAAIGYRESRGPIARIASEWHLPRTPMRRDSFPSLPPLTTVAFHTGQGKTARFSAAARRLFGRLPEGPLVPDTLASRIARIYRGDLFLSLWPSFRSDAHATSLSFEVREHPRAEVTAAGGFERDRGGRASVNLTLRPFAWASPPLLRASGTLGRFGRSAYGSIEPSSLGRRASGFFARLAARHTDTRIFDEHRDWTLLGTNRVEALAGIQATLPLAHTLQVGGGAGRIWSGGRTREGPVAAARLDAPGRYSRRLDVMAFAGEGSYSTARFSLSAEFPTTRATIRPTLMAGWASDATPVDELQGVGAAQTLVGLRHDEWLGRRAVALELRLVRHVFSGIDASVYLQTAHVADAVSRTDLADRLHVATGIGLRGTVPFGPLSMDFGFGESGLRRLEVSLGEEF